MIIKRDITEHLLTLANQYPVIAVMGPRQSGKTTLAKECFKHYAYVTLEDLDRRLAAKTDPRTFLENYAQKPGLIIDEIQEVPELLSYMQGIVDSIYRPGYFILTGSQNFLMHEKISQTLAGRIALLTLLPLTTHELQKANLLPNTLEELMVKGCYPRLYAQPIEPETWYVNYTTTYIEKDVRQTLHITDVLSFQRFLKLCAARVGNMLNYAELARDCDISPNTAKAWLSVLEASYIIKLLTPYYRNFNKRVIKSPKLYFYDTGLACSLLGIKTSQDIALSPLRGALFESFVISELFKFMHNQNIQPSLFYWRDIQGHEVDCLIEKTFDTLIPLEIKARRTIADDLFKSLNEWKEITKQPHQGFIIYAGKENYRVHLGQLIGWPAIHELLQTIMQ